jgi:hypothetical protein
MNIRKLHEKNHKLLREYQVNPNQNQMLKNRRYVKLTRQDHHTCMCHSESSDNERESQIDESDKCCVCKLFYPKQVKESSSLLITKWVV